MISEKYLGHKIKFYFVKMGDFNSTLSNDTSSHMYGAKQSLIENSMNVIKSVKFHM